MTAEFDLIKQYFTRSSRNPCTQLSVGDDCALLAVPEGYELAITTDTMVENVHFFSGVDPQQLGHKLLAVNLSDLASMGAEPVAITLALTMPAVNSDWLAAFSKGLFALADKYHLDLVGGDTTSGALTLGIQALGVVPKGQSLRRSTAQIGDLIYVTGSLGDAGLGLKSKQGYTKVSATKALQRFNVPEPRVAEGIEIRALAHACIDISDGLAGDLGHILDKSAVGACLDYESLPLSAEVLAYVRQTGDWQMPLLAGEDYELCFTLSPENARRLNIDCSCIGVIEKQHGLRLRRDGVCAFFKHTGFEHFV